MDRQTIVVTGGTRGIGRAVSLQAAQQGYNVCAIYLNNGEAATDFEEDLTSIGKNHLVCQANLSLEEDVKSLFEKCVNEFGGVDILVNNAGIISGPANFEDISLDRLKTTLDNNVGSYFLCSQEAIKIMKKKSKGVIVNVSSAASRLGSPGEYVDYAMSKGAIDSMTIGLSKELSSAGIRVVAVRPGFIDTSIHGEEGIHARLKRKNLNIPIGRPGTAEEVAQSIMWLASDEASYINGCFVDMAGGL